MYKNLKDYLNLLESEGELLKIECFVDPILEMAEIADRESKSKNGGKALLFLNNGTQFPVAMNLFGSEKRIAMALGVNSTDDLSKNIADFLSIVKKPRQSFIDKLKLLPELKKAARWFPRHTTKRGECQAVVDLNPDLTKLPVLQTWPADGGRFITLPLVHTLDPLTHQSNVGMYRAQIFSKTTTGLHWHRHKTGARHFALASSLAHSQWSHQMPVAIAIGGDPAYTYAATAPLPDGIDEYILAGFLRNKPVSLVKCITNDIEVPSDCDFVIEGFVDTTEKLACEGPFGDHTGFYSLQDNYPTLKVTCITHRQNAIYPATVVGVPPMEDRYIALATEKIFLEPIRAAISPEIVELTMPWQGVAHNLAIAKIEKEYQGQGFKVANALWGAGQMAFCKFLIITDNNSAPFNVNGIEAEILISKGIADVLDHAGEDVGLGGKMCFDTTSDKAKPYKIEIIYDEGVENLNDDEKLWIALANVDPARDVVIEGSKITFDGRSKKLERRDFPNIVTMSDDIIAKVDSRWSEYNIGEFKKSPSLRYKKLNIGNGATKIYATPTLD